jgi:hypothetical protein
MRVSFELKERHFLFLVGILAVVSAVGIVTGYGGSSPSTMGHTPGEISGGTFGVGNYVFPNNLDVGGSLGVSGDVDASGNITGTLRITCPTGFTSVEAAGNQLGCMQKTEANSGNKLDWRVANDYCFTNYGGKLPSLAEWYISMSNFVLTDETDDWEWVDDTGEHRDLQKVVGSGDLSAQTWAWGYDPQIFRCWIPS